MRYLWRDDLETISAETVQEAAEVRNRMYGYDAETAAADAFDAEQVPDDEVVTVTFQDGVPDGNYMYPSWVDGEPEAELSWIHEPDYDEEGLPIGDRGIARVAAPARVWAKHEAGSVCSMEV